MIAKQNIFSCKHMNPSAKAGLLVWTVEETAMEAVHFVRLTPVLYWINALCKQQDKEKGGKLKWEEEHIPGEREFLSKVPRTSLWWWQWMDMRGERFRTPLSSSQLFAQSGWAGDCLNACSRLVCLSYLFFTWEDPVHLTSSAPPARFACVRVMSACAQVPKHSSLFRCHGFLSTSKRKENFVSVSGASASKLLWQNGTLFTLQEDSWYLRLSVWKERVEVDVTLPFLR